MATGYKHGIYGQEVPTSLVPMTQIGAGLPVVFGTAPVHLAADAAKPNTPLLCYKYDEAVSALGYSDDWQKYTLCEFMKSQFALYNVAPVVFVNVLDPAKHKNAVTDQTVTLTEHVGKLAKAVILSTLKVKKASAGQPLTAGVDYTATYGADGALVITALSGGEVHDAATLYLDYDELAPEKVTALAVSIRRRVHIPGLSSWRRSIRNSD